MAGHPSVKKRQKELARKERKQEKAGKRDQRRVERNNPDGTPRDDIEFALDQFGQPIIPEAFAEMAELAKPGAQPLAGTEGGNATPVKRGE